MSKWQLIFSLPLSILFLFGSWDIFKKEIDAALINEVSPFPKPLSESIMHGHQRDYPFEMIAEKIRQSFKKTPSLEAVLFYNNQLAFEWGIPNSQYGINNVALRDLVADRYNRQPQKKDIRWINTKLSGLHIVYQKTNIKDGHTIELIYQPIKRQRILDRTFPYWVYCGIFLFLGCILLSIKKPQALEAKKEILIAEKS